METVGNYFYFIFALLILPSFSASWYGKISSWNIIKEWLIKLWLKSNSFFFLIWFKSWYVRTCYVLTVPNLLETSSCFLEQFLTETKTCRDWKAFIPLAIFLSDILSENKTDHRTTLIRPIFYGGMQNMLDILSSSDQRISSLNALYPRSYFCLVDTNSSTTHAVEFY